MKFLSASIEVERHVSALQRLQIASQCMEDLAECTCVSLDVRGILWMCFRKGKSGSTTSSQQSQSPKQESE